MKRNFFVTIVFCVACFLSVHSQVRVHFTVNRFPQGASGDSIFVAGNFNGWQPHDRAAALTYTKNSYSGEITLPRGSSLEFKFTLGDWNTVETNQDGGSINNRTALILNDTTLLCEVLGWNTQHVIADTAHTASPQVHLLDGAFFSPELNRFRAISVYLPADYHHNSKRYPVMYMLDGQNLFDRQSAYQGEWEVDETLDSLVKMGHLAAIVVAVHSDSNRIREYSPYVFKYCQTPEADAYLKFMIATLKPYIDKKYRTKKESQFTSIAGSSLGGLLAYYAWLHHPTVFGSAGVFSPSFWVAMPALEKQTDSLAHLQKGKVFFYMGEKEDDEDFDKFIRLTDRVGAKSKAVAYRVVDPAGKHQEWFWRKWFAVFFVWIQSDGLNKPIKLH